MLRRRLVGLGLAAIAVGGAAGRFGAAPLGADDQTGALAGRVVAEEDGTALAGATVTLISAHLEAGDLTLAADEDGRFALAAAPAGLYDVHAERDGYRAGAVGGVRVTPARTVSVTVTLERRVPGDGGY